MFRKPEVGSENKNISVSKCWLPEFKAQRWEREREFPAIQKGHLNCKASGDCWTWQTKISIPDKEKYSDSQTFETSCKLKLTKAVSKPKLKSRTYWIKLPMLTAWRKKYCFSRSRYVFQSPFYHNSQHTWFTTKNKNMIHKKRKRSTETDTEMVPGATITK